MPHDHHAAHDHAHPGALASHVDSGDAAADLHALSAQFIEGFQAATDKQAWLALAGPPLERADPAGGPPLKLVDVRLETAWQVGAASPAFGARELGYLPLPGPMIRERTNMTFVYVSLDAREDLDLRDWLRAKAPA